MHGMIARTGRWAIRLAVLGGLLANTGCASLVSSAASKFADNLSAAVLNQNDPEIVRDGAPAYRMPELRDFVPRMLSGLSRR